MGVSLPRIRTYVRTARLIGYFAHAFGSRRVPGSPAVAHHATACGEGVSSADFRETFDESAWSVDFGAWASLFAEVRARYVVMVTRHLGGYSLWPSAFEHPRVPGAARFRRDPTRAVRDRNLCMAAIRLRRHGLDIPGATG
ncbi:alpha-L-fucosidase [Nocardia asteroides]|uniref:alpha-L-fucosidase n=1 Tax=Nocardia asteroides TaxID=1824 RepID=UPI00341CFA03